MRNLTLAFGAIAERAGFLPGPDGKLNLPATQETAESLAEAATAMIGGEWHPGDERYRVTLTGAGPVWGYLAVAHALHGRAVSLTYESPNATITVFRHGV